MNSVFWKKKIRNNGFNTRFVEKQIEKFLNKQYCPSCFDCCIGSDIWFQDDFWEAFSLCFQSSFSTAWYLEESWQVFHDRSLLWRCFRGFVLRVLEYYSAVWCSAADTHLKTTRPSSQWCQFFNWGCGFECDLSHRRSVAVLCILYKIRCNPMHPLCGALPVPYVPVRVTGGAAIAHRFTYAPPRCSTSQYRWTFIPLSVSLWNDLSDPVFEGVGVAGFKSRANAFLLA